MINFQDIFNKVIFYKTDCSSISQINNFKIIHFNYKCCVINETKNKQWLEFQTMRSKLPYSTFCKFEYDHRICLFLAMFVDRMIMVLSSYDIQLEY